jgi:hypothetical protein
VIIVSSFVVAAPCAIRRSPRPALHRPDQYQELVTAYDIKGSRLMRPFDEDIDE